MLATGSELRAPGRPLAPGEIYESNTSLLAAQLAAAGATSEVLPVVADDEEATRRRSGARARRPTCSITSGGVSVGPHDLVRAALATLGAEEVFWRVAVKPGQAGRVRACAGATLVFGLPGNPVSSLVGFELFVRPALRALQGERRPAARPTSPDGSRVRCDATCSATQLVRARSRVERRRVVLDPLTGQDSHMIVARASADALVLVAPGDGELPAGASVGYLRI